MKFDWLSTLLFVRSGIYSFNDYFTLFSLCLIFASFARGPGDNPKAKFWNLESGNHRLSGNWILLTKKKNNRKFPNMKTLDCIILPVKQRNQYKEWLLASQLTTSHICNFQITIASILHKYIIYLFFVAHNFSQATPSENCSQIMSADKYMSISLCQTKPIVHLVKEWITPELYKL